MKNDFRALCAELLREFSSLYSDMSAQVDFNDAYLERTDALITRARAALEQPEQQEIILASEVGELVELLQREAGCYDSCTDVRATLFARAANLLEKLSTTTPQPISVSERIPEENDCDENGRCWAWDNVGGSWYLWEPCPPFIVTPADALQIWLPHWALPIPTTETKE